MNLTNKQKEAYTKLVDKKTSFVFYGGAAGGGKTWIGCWWEGENCILYPGTRWFIGRDSLKDTRESVLVTWNKVSKAHPLIEGEWKYSDNAIQFNNGSVIVFLDLSYYPEKDPFFERFGSKEFTGGWIEEAGEVKFEAFDTLKSRVGRHLNVELGLKSKILITANPKKNWLYTEFYNPYRKNELPKSHAFVQALHTDNTHLSDEYRENLNSIKDKVKKQRLLLGIFDYDDEDNALCQFQKINDLFTNSFVQEGQKFITADIALTNDNFVAFVWNGLRIVDYLCIKGIGAKELCDKLESMAKVHQVPRSNIVYNADGLGEYLKSYLPGGIGINNNMKSPYPDYGNIKDCFYYYLADYINNNKIYVACPMAPDFKEKFILQCQMIKRHSEIGEKLRIMPKADIKELLGESPDISEALIYRMFGVIYWKV